MVQLPATAAIDYVAACWVSGAGEIFVRGCFCPGVFCPGGTFSPGVFCPGVLLAGETFGRGDFFPGVLLSGGSFALHPSTIWVRPLFTELGPKPPPSPKKADFAMQTNI